MELLVILSTALCMGLILGTLGAGGGIIGVPILIYGLNWEPRVAIAHSLFIIACISSVTALREWKVGHLHLNRAIPFALGGLSGSFFASRYIAGLISQQFQLALFLVVVLSASLLMLKNALRKPNLHPVKHIALVYLVLVGLVTGMISGLVGIGGGFLIVPSLVILANFSMNAAAGTSLFVVAANTLSGSIGYFTHVQYDFRVVGIFAVVGIVSARLGAALRSNLPDRYLKIVFAIFLMAISVFMTWDKFLKA